MESKNVHISVLPSMEKIFLKDDSLLVEHKFRQGKEFYEEKEYQ